VGAHCSIFNGPLTDGDTKTRFIQAIQAKQSFVGEVLNYRKNGSSFWNRLSLSPVLDEQGKLSNFISINTDVSERKRLEQALLDKNQELLRATRVAEKANRAKSEFLSSMSHELRSPLHSILGFAQLLEVSTPALTPSQQGKNKEILRGGWYLLTLINEILDLALIESGKLALSLEPLPLAQVLLDCERLIEPQAQSSGIHVSFPSLDSELLVIADPVRLKQVLVNLLSNAIKYNRTDGTVDVTVSAGSTGKLRISVHDTGEGLSDEKMAQLYQPFNRLGQESSATEGTGIGLVVARRLTELMAGTIGVQSTLGVGSVFWLELGIAPPLTIPAVAHRTAERPPSAGPASPSLSPCKVLYVDENRANMELVDQILADRPKLQLLRARDGLEGIEVARAHLPQVILLDINLPGLSGVEVLKILRQDPATRHIPVLALSANAMPLDVVKGLSAGFFRYLTKPFKVDEFLKALDLALALALAKPALPDV
jgi:signal transduction histidine kinase/CheY-like chemotaxis protein